MGLLKSMVTVALLPIKLVVDVAEVVADEVKETLEDLTDLD